MKLKDPQKQFSKQPIRPAKISTKKPAKGQLPLRDEIPNDDDDFRPSPLASDCPGQKTLPVKLM